MQLTAGKWRTRGGKIVTIDKVQTVPCQSHDVFHLRVHQFPQSVHEADLGSFAS